MPRYFMNIHEGRSHTSPAAAMPDAVLAARELLAEKIRCGEIVHGQRIGPLADAVRLVEIVPSRDRIRIADAESCDGHVVSGSLLWRTTARTSERD